MKTIGARWLCRVAYLHRLMTMLLLLLLLPVTGVLSQVRRRALTWFNYLR